MFIIIVAISCKTARTMSVFCFSISSKTGWDFFILALISLYFGFSTKIHTACLASDRLIVLMCVICAEKTHKHVQAFLWWSEVSKPRDSYWVTFALAVKSGRSVLDRHIVGLGLWNSLWMYWRATIISGKIEKWWNSYVYIKFWNRVYIQESV